MAEQAGLDSWAVLDAITAVAAEPEDYVKDVIWGDLAVRLVEVRAAHRTFVQRKEPAPWHKWGDHIENDAIQQMRNACKLPVSVSGALMPDAHTGYGLPIGGVLATENAVIPYAVGVDIACRVRLSVLDIPVSALDVRRNALIRVLETETRFGVGCSFDPVRTHPVMDDSAWRDIPVLRELRAKAEHQLGTSGAGNHFVEFGVLVVSDPAVGVAPGEYVALMSHSGSRGTGEGVAKQYSSLAMRKHPELPNELIHLAWLDMDSPEGREYWRAMTLMGRYSAANHELIHEHVVGHLGVKVLAMVENHHNFAWKEKHGGREVIVHRKGAIRAEKDRLAIIPGSMASPGFIVRGLGNPLSLNSAAHGAGRAMSRMQAKRRFSWNDVNDALVRSGVSLISAGLDEAPMAYKDIRKVMAAQDDLVEQIARFDPRLVKMAPAEKSFGWRKKGRKKGK